MILCSLILRWQLVAGGDVMLLDVGWHMIAGGEVKLLDVEMAFGRWC